MGFNENSYSLDGILHWNFVTGGGGGGGGGGGIRIKNFQLTKKRGVVAVK